MREHQKLMEEYDNGLNSFFELLDSYQAMLADYYRPNGTNTSLKTLQAMYQSLIKMQAEINTLGDRLNALPAEIEIAQDDIDLTVKPFSFQLP